MKNNFHIVDINIKKTTQPITLPREGQSEKRKKGRDKKRERERDFLCN